VNPGKYTLFDGFAHLSSGLSCGLAGLAAGMAIGIVGDAGVRWARHGLGGDSGIPPTLLLATEAAAKLFAPDGPA
jgi:hypothetical protein